MTRLIETVDVHAEEKHEGDNVEQAGAVVEATQGDTGGHHHGDEPEADEESFLIEIDEDAGVGAGGDGNAGAEHHDHADGDQQEGGHENPEIPNRRLVIDQSRLRKVHLLARTHRFRSNSATASLKTRPRSDMFTNMSKLAEAGDSNTTPSGATAR